MSSKSYVFTARTQQTFCKTIPELLRVHNEKIPDSEAFVFFTSEMERTSMTWKELYVGSKNFARSLLGLGVKPKDTVAISGPNCPSWLFAVFGSMMVGAIPADVTFGYSDGSDVIALLQKMDNVSTFILHPGFHDQKWTIFKAFLTEFDSQGNIKCDQVPSLKHLVFMEKPEKETYMLLVEDLAKIYFSTDNPLPNVDSNNVAFLFQTSGSTGLSKLVAHSHRSLSYFLSNVYGEGITERYNDQSFGFISGFPFEVVTGIKRVTGWSTKEDYDPFEVMIKAVQKERCSVIYMLPPTVQRLLDSKESLPVDWPVKTIACSGQPLSSYLASVIGTVSETFLAVYGATESFQCCRKVVSNPNEFKNFNCGKPTNGVEIKIVDDEGNIAPINTRGEIYVRSHHNFKCYVNDPEGTSRVKTESGWYKTDDIGYIDENGEVFAEGRKSDVIISGGTNVIPTILEAVLSSLQGVKDAIVVPIPHPVMYQVICACVIPDPGFELTEEKLRGLCEKKYLDKLRSFTVVPTHYILYEEFPKSRTGKTDRKKLMMEAHERFQ
ncbi:hypothetical protein CHS0354_035773 [Potamilus streckersoni]|uniref:Uncharacterized protein n=1 Tax=Potamilus streckersoni TaxID=2493646 RepID=A0AAE0VN50_9BIVA|nr:hypothetical protein CHS0354_035773 [Potamilus streckersoni]